MKKRNRSEAQRTKRQIGLWLPIILVCTAVLLLVLPSDRMFLAGSTIGGAAAVFTTGILILREKAARIFWLTGASVLLGYSLGSFNTAIRLFSEGFSVSATSGSTPTELCSALAISLLVSALLFSIGTLEPRITINPNRITNSDQRFVWIGLVPVAVAFASGTLVFRGITVSDSGQISALGSIAETLIEILPALTVFLYGKAGSKNQKLLLIVAGLAEFLVATSQTRRMLIYCVLISFLALTLRGFKLQLLRWKTIATLVITVTCVYMGMTFFQAMRFSQQGSGNNKLAFSETSGRALNLLTQGDDARFMQSLTENLRDRTFIIGYLSNLIAASATHAPLYGEDALLCLKLSIPSVLYPDKSAIDVRAEEVIANPQFGLPVDDDANSLLTSGVSDFGVIGAFMYPVFISLVASVFLRIVSKRVPEIVKLIIVLMFANVMIQSEKGLLDYFDLLRQTIIFALLCWPIAKLARRRSQLRGTRSLAPIPAGF